MRRRIADFVLRRRAVASLVVIVAIGLALPFSNPAAMVALVPVYGLALYRGLWAGLAGSALVTVAQLVKMDHVLEPISAAVFCGAVVGAARMTALRRTSAARERELLAEAAASEERLRIARELHDAVGHDVSLMVVQAEALAAVTGDERADAIAALGRRTMGELHRTLHVLRDDGGTAPQHGLNDLAGVLESARSAGVPITLTVEGAPRALPAALDASAYRIVQEAVTNVIRHAGGAPAAVTVHYGADALHLTVADDGAAASANGTGHGHGLIGMRERVAAFGGTLEAGPRPERGFQVRAELPYAP
jgi:signal transduction histidine kinase